jgi:hypothetical protein
MPSAAAAAAALLLLLLTSGAADAQNERMHNGKCPSYTRTTLWEGTKEYECGGPERGTCDRATGKCTCLPGPHWATWQVNAANIRAPGYPNCGQGVRAQATEADIAIHEAAFAATFAAEFFGCWWLFGPLPAAAPAPPVIVPLGERPWLLPKLAMLTSCGTLVATILSMLLADQNCNCYWIHDFDNYQTISIAAEFPPMSVITPTGVLVSSFLLTGSTWAILKRARGLPCYSGGLARAALWLWACIAWNAAAWGLAVNVFFNESWGAPVLYTCKSVTQLSLAGAAKSRRAKLDSGLLARLTVCLNRSD